MNNFLPINNLIKNSKKYKNIYAVEDENKNYSYKEFWNLVKNTAFELTKIKKKPLVSIFGERNILSYISMFGTLLCGGTYVPISSSLPIERVKRIISISKSDVIICPYKYISTFKKNFVKKKILTEKNFFCRPKNFKKKHIIENKLAYIIFTSGSTGEPKGVCISRESLNHYLKWLLGILKIFPGEKCSQFPEIGFDLSVADIYGTLCSGGTLISAESEFSNTFPGRFIKEKKIAYLICVPSLIDLINNANDLNKTNIKSLKKIFFCGEPLFKLQVESIFKANKGVEIINAYGPTEATVSCTFKNLTNLNYKKFSKTSMSIGEPIPGVRLELNKNEDSAKKEGEIIISGIQVANGYLDKKKNVGKFFFKENNRFFKTGDYASVIDGEMYFKNRIDNQIKIKGHRIELDEIDHNLRKMCLRNVCSVVVRKNIISFVGDVKKFKKQDILKKLSKIIPVYMLPHDIIKLKNLPINQNGKINKKKLLEFAKKVIS